MAGKSKSAKVYGVNASDLFLAFIKDPNVIRSPSINVRGKTYKIPPAALKKLVEMLDASGRAADASAVADVLAERRSAGTRGRVSELVATGTKTWKVSGTSQIVINPRTVFGAAEGARVVGVLDKGVLTLTLQ